MTYYEAAIEILRSAQHPLTSREITDRALEKRLITPHGKNPYSAMSARLHLKALNDQELVKIETPGNRRAKRGSVRWTLRETISRTA
jgi:HB1, ASXL, restriction endonuclease HTH domain